MAGADAAHRRATWPIVYGPRPTATPEPAPRLAWALFVLLGLPFGLMTVLVVLADLGVTVPLFGALWMPFPPELVKPFLGLAVFAATLAYLTYRLGHRNGFHAGTGVGLAAARNYAEAHARNETPAPAEPEVPPPPMEPAVDPNATPPPPDEDLEIPPAGPD